MRQCSKWVGLSAVFFGLLGPIRATNADVLLVNSDSTNEVYRYQVGPSGTSTLDRTLTANLDIPGGLAISPSNELFVVNQDVLFKLLQLFQEGSSILRGGPTSRPDVGEIADSMASYDQWHPGLTPAPPAVSTT